MRTDNNPAWNTLLTGQNLWPSAEQLTAIICYCAVDMGAVLIDERHIGFCHEGPGGSHESQTFINTRLVPLSLPPDSDLPV